MQCIVASESVLQSVAPYWIAQLYMIQVSEACDALLPPNLYCSLLPLALGQHWIAQLYMIQVSEACIVPESVLQPTAPQHG